LDPEKTHICLQKRTLTEAQLNSEREN